MVALPAWCASYIGLPFMAGGRTRDGLDCWGLVALVWAEHFGKPLPDYDGPFWTKGADYAAVGAAAQRFTDRFTPVEPGSERAGDGVLIRMRGAPIHVAVVVEPGKMLHIEAGTGACVEDYRGLAWRHRVVGFYRYG